MKKKLFIIFSLFFILFITNAQNDYSVDNGGNWSSGSTWDNGVPSASNCMDSIFISVSDVVLVDVMVDLKSCPPIVVIIRGTLEFKTGKKLYLPEGSKIIIEAGGLLSAGNGGGNSNLIDIGNTTVWTAADGDVSGPATISSDPLPVNLLSFNAIVNESSVDITWTTASEINNDYFVVEKSVDGKNWQKVVQIQGAGNSTQQIEYFEVDNEPFEGISYYRLKQVDFNGEYSYSNIVPVKYIPVDQSTSDINIFPNPIISGDVDLHIQFKALENKEVLVVLRDIKGQEYYSKVTIVKEDNQIIAIPLDSNLSAGVYLVIASSEDKLYSKKLVVK